ncbi:MAG: hypothetical protein F6K11_18290 [Leptolyngbya sp. SIO3F4]|nr:hypothetical protein [Leptolyngbya sp. SIO3F4]
MAASRTGDTAAQRAEIAMKPGSWHEITAYPAFLLRHDRLTAISMF